jgi:phage terminase small subunit
MGTIDLSKYPSFQALSAQQQVFVVEYLKDFNATQAAIRAKYSKKTAHSQGPRLLENVEVKKALDEIKAQIAGDGIASVQEIARFFTLVMRGNVKDVVSWNQEGLVFTANSEELDKDTSRLIKKIKVTEKTSQKGDWTECKTEVELHDPVRAGELLGQYHGMFKEKIEHSGPNGGPISYEVLDYSKSVKPKNGNS